MCTCSKLRVFLALTCERSRCDSAVKQLRFGVYRAIVTAVIDRRIRDVGFPTSPERAMSVIGLRKIPTAVKNRNKIPLSPIGNINHNAPAGGPGPRVERGEVTQRYFLATHV